ncbi:ERF family protein [Achromobacter sp. 2789STDY5608628]|uniref:ERF family protein n=1 Tax=Achromobacter sp. 2789STDY5608628 TaxID=1806493 RepID=UPI0006C308D9|nr:ERF family protein [Achromobacter sp. 2789STDY5608628]CUJ54535.1 ERF superfamily [Achromobacter sp. 2789STDY5608628]
MTEIIDAPAREVAPRPEPSPGQVPALAANSPMGMMLAAVQQGATLEQVEKMMDLQERWAKAEAKKAYDEAFANFKAEAVKIIKGKGVTDGPLKGKSYAELHDVVNAVTPALSKHGLSSSWKLTRDEKDWMEVTCYLRHVGGHEESVSMGGPPDNGGAKNAIQARASTKTYLERYTLKAITGLSEQKDDNDGNGAAHAAEDLRDEWISKLAQAETLDAAARVWQEGCQAIEKFNNLAVYSAFKKSYADKRAMLKQEEK